MLLLLDYCETNPYLHTVVDNYACSHTVVVIIDCVMLNTELN